MSRSSSSASTTRSFSSEANAQDLKPIKGYLSNRRELARQLFKSVKPDKIRMMLPQVLKNANLRELEERCTGELCGMSEARILCILKGRTMSGSSDTGETDDSGPSLEIISDTEEWLTDTEVTIKQEPSSSGVSKAKRPKAAKLDKRKSRAQKRKDRDNSGVKSKGSTVARLDSNLKPKKEKQEGESRPVTSTADNKEGESLLDLLELEMRARAIRALIRKEEATPQASDAKEKRTEEALVAAAAMSEPVKSSAESVVSASLASSESSHGKEASGQSNEVKKAREGGSGSGEDEDVVFVVAKPTPMIELVSSEDETSGGDKDSRKRASNNEDPKRSAIQRAGKRETATSAAAEVAAPRDLSSNGRTVTIDKSNDGSNSLKIIVTKRLTDSSNGHTSGKTIKTRKIADNELDKSGAREKNSPKILESNDPQFSAKGLFKKVRRKENLRSKRKTIGDSKRNKTDESSVKASPEVGEASAPARCVAPDEKTEDRVSCDVPVESAVKLEIPERAEDVASCANEAPTATRLDGSNKGEREEESRIPITDDDRLDDFEEIIDLDDYPDDMEEIENKDEVKKIKGEIVTQARTERKTPQITADTIIPSREATESAETWASRYYQTDDVQNVIKESKIQSEIRKRLRERQRLSKSNNSPKLQHGSPGDAGNATLEKAEEKMVAKATTGSVGEYLALKNSTSDKRCADDDIEATDAASKSPRSSLEVPSDEKDSTSSPDERKTSSDDTRSDRPLQPDSLTETAAIVE